MHGGRDSRLCYLVDGSVSKSTEDDVAYFFGRTSKHLTVVTVVSASTALEHLPHSNMLCRLVLIEQRRPNVV